MVNLTITPALKAALDAADCLHLDIEDASQSLTSRQSLVNPAVGNLISHDRIIAISKLLRDHHKKNSIDSVPCHLDDLLRGAKIFREPQKPTVEPISSYRALMARLRQEEEARAYERMINPPHPLETFADRFPSTAKPDLFTAGAQPEIDEDDEITYAHINRQMALIINILVSIVACSVAIWMASSHWSTPKRLGLSMGGSFMIGVGEVVVYAGYLRRVRDAREKSKKPVEVKEIIKTWVIGGDDRNDQAGFQVIMSKSAASENVRRRRAI